MKSPEEQEEQGENGKVGNIRLQKKKTMSDPTTTSLPCKQSKITPVSPALIFYRLVY